MESSYIPLNKNKLGDIPWEWVCNLLGLVSGLIVGSLIAWRTAFFWRSTKDVVPLVMLSIIAYEVVSIIVLKLLKFPKIKDFGLVFLVVSLAYLSVFSIVAMFRFYYSRSFLFATF